MRFRKCQRIKRQADFERFRTEGVLRKGGGFFVKMKKTPANLLPRFAVIVGKKIGEAYERNRIKRIFREIFRQEQSRLDREKDYLVIAQKGILPKFWPLKEEFLRLCAAFPKSFLSIAIDGTAASGKSSTAYALARKYRLLNVNTGNHYRTLTFYFLRKNISMATDMRIGEELKQLVLASQLDGISEHLSVNGEIPLRMALHSEMLNYRVASFAQIPELRDKLKIYQQHLVEWAKKMNFAGIVMEGRDISTTIMPQADVKIFLTADSRVRTHRRASDGEKDAVEQRDSMDHCHRDSNAITIDTSKNNLEQVVAIIEKYIPPKLTLNSKELHMAPRCLGTKTQGVNSL
ncbi:MAG: ribonuclease P protein component [Puniceicoccales bacterium]|jgi:cytidylate kinase|nr:ribonuclease P protein component [Puniceicoccales bacterium]